MGLKHHLHLRRNRGRRFCPLMKEWCTKGWTPAMGTGPDGFPMEGACASWQPVAIFEDGKPETLHDCAVYGWTPDLLTELGTEISHGTASTDKVANQVRAGIEASLNVNRFITANLVDGDKQLEHETPQLNGPAENQEGEDATS